MERIRAASPTLSDESPVPDLAVQAPGPKVLPLREWVEAVRSPGVTREEVEGLLHGLSAPLAEGESTRERADQLLHLLQDEALVELTDQDGRQAGPAALEALLALGYPYALEVHPEVLSRLDRLRPWTLPRSGRWGLGLAAFAALLPTVTVVLRSTRDWSRYLDALAILGGVLFLPAVLSVVAERYRLRWLKALCNSGLVLMGSLSLLFARMFSSDGDFPARLASMGIGLALLGSFLCLRHREEP
ncbi:hypothetical protein [Archangium sp.]|uniref:hypothetical protein n=1 Tax=Archangium sp. TaxID=1872627 RepID=UPI00286C90CA|nr:hypothetical protein [Archangium sp.]